MLEREVYLGKFILSSYNIQYQRLGTEVGASIYLFIYFQSSEVNTDSDKDGEMRKSRMTDIKNERVPLFFLPPVQIVVLAESTLERLKH